MRVLASVFAILLTACAAQHTTQNTPGTTAYRHVPPSEFVNTVPVAATSTEAATIIAKRDAGSFGAALRSIFMINGRPIARLRNGEYLTMQVPPGRYNFGVEWSSPSQLVPTPKTNQTSMECEPGKSYTLRIYPVYQKGMFIQAVTE
jgi:hypothetical protein